MGRDEIERKWEEREEMEEESGESEWKGYDGVKI